MTSERWRDTYDSWKLATPWDDLEDDPREDWPVHQPECLDAPIPGRVWFGGCEPGGDWDSEYARYTGSGPRIDPATGVCEGCGERGCRVCGRERCPDHFACVVDESCGLGDAA